MKLVRFEDINGRETFVNPDRVNQVSDYGSGTTEINFGDKQASVIVRHLDSRQGREHPSPYLPRLAGSVERAIAQLVVA